MSGVSGLWSLRSISMAIGGAFVGSVIAVLGVLVVVEISYRFQWPDPHGAEFKAFNPNLDFDDSQVSTVLALGDSFTAGAESWPAALQEELGAGWRVVNGGIGGTTITHAELFAGPRIRKFRPDIVVFQTYVGNDLLDLVHPRGAEGVGFLRRSYWWLVDHGSFAPWYLNHRAAALAVQRPFDPAAADAAVGAPFGVERYSPRDRWLSGLAPEHVEQQILVEGPSMEVAWGRYQQALLRLAEQCADADADLVILVIPHCVQVAPVYRERFAVMGARWADGDLLARSPSPFVTRVHAALPSVQVIDVLPAMQQEESYGARLYSTNDPHLTPGGFRCVALQVSVVIKDPH